MTFDSQQFRINNFNTINLIENYRYSPNSLTEVERDIFTRVKNVFEELYFTMEGQHGPFYPAVKKLEILNSIFNIDIVPAYEGYYPKTFLAFGPEGQRLISYYLNRAGEYEYNQESGEFVTVAGRKFLFGNRNILDYSTDPLKYLDFLGLKDEKTDEETCYLGIELEVERKNNTPKDIMHQVMKDLGKHYAILKKDGSLRNDGFEIVTAPGTYGLHLKSWDKFFANSAKYLDSYNNGHCGIHVHINRKAFTPLHLAKMTSFYNYEDNFDFITKIAGRISNYAQFKNKEMLDKFRGKSATKRKATKRKSLKTMLQHIHGYTGNRERYEAVNLRKPDTVEIRIFRGNVAKLGFFKNIDFVQAVFDYTKIAACMKFDDGKDNSLHYMAFLRWLKDQPKYNSLKLWLSKHGLLELKEKKVKEDYQIKEEEVKRCA